MASEKTLVIVLGETRAHELSFDNFKKNVIDELDADLCICIGANKDYDYNNPFYQLAKYRFIYDEPDDYADAFDYAYSILSNGRNKYEMMDGVDLWSTVANNARYSSNIKSYGEFRNDLNINHFDDEMLAIIPITQRLGIFRPENIMKLQLFGINGIDIDKYNPVRNENTVSLKKPIPWREFLKIKDQFMGGIKDDKHQHDGSAGILIFYRWFLLHHLTINGLIDKYDRFVITRSDFRYQLPHPKMSLLDKKYMWIPDGEYHGGLTDRHVVLTPQNIVPYLNILNNMVLRSNEYFMNMKSRTDWNLERLIKFHLIRNNVFEQVRHFPYVMYSVRNVNGTTRWATGLYLEDLGYYIKYIDEYVSALMYRYKQSRSSLSIDDFYRIIIERNYINKSSIA